MDSEEHREVAEENATEREQERERFRSAYPELASFVDDLRGVFGEGVRVRQLTDLRTGRTYGRD